MRTRQRRDRELLLRRGSEIEHAKRAGRRIPTPYFNVVIAPVDSRLTKVAVIVGRKFGPATRRNRAKRRIRELARSVEARLSDHYHVLIFPKQPVVTMPFRELALVWERLLRREGLVGG